MKNFRFYNTQKDIVFNDCKIVHIRKNTTNKLDIFNQFECGLNIPTYYGKNWDAFDDNLMNLHFVKEKNVIIIHEDIPFKNYDHEKRTYIEILGDIVSHWQAFPEHKFFVYFPENCREELTQINRAFE